MKDVTIRIITKVGTQDRVLEATIPFDKDELPNTVVAMGEAAARVIPDPPPDVVADLKSEKDNAYWERNLLVAALSKLFPAFVGRTDIPGWNPEWHGCVYIELPTGQVSWHFHDEQAYLFDHLSPFTGTWDGHDTEEKYQRLENLQVGARADA